MPADAVPRARGRGQFGFVLARQHGEHAAQILQRRPGGGFHGLQCRGRAFRCDVGEVDGDTCLDGDHRQSVGDDVVELAGHAQAFVEYGPFRGSRLAAFRGVFGGAGA